MHYAMVSKILWKPFWLASSSIMSGVLAISGTMTYMHRPHCVRMLGHTFGDVPLSCCHALPIRLLSLTPRRQHSIGLASATSEPRKLGDRRSTEKRPGTCPIPNTFLVRRPSLKR